MPEPVAFMVSGYVPAGVPFALVEPPSPPQPGSTSKSGKANADRITRFAFVP